MVNRWLILLLLTITIFSWEGCTGSSQSFTASPADLKLVEEVANGKKYTASANNQTIFVLNLTGTAYQMGVAYGTLMRKEIPILYDMFIKYIEDTVLPGRRVPKLMKSIAGSAVKAVLDLNYKITKKYTPRRFEDEMAGLSAGSGLPKAVFRQVNMIAELTKAACSIVGAWGKATSDGRLLHLRALDWDAFAPLWQYSQIAVYHSTEPGANSFANVGWAGFVGSITSFSKKVSVGEKYRHQNEAKNETRFGKPWNYVLRDMVQFGQNITHALEIGNNSDRTCSVFLGVSSIHPEPTFRLVEYSAKEFRVFSDKNYPANSTHPRLDNLLYMSYGDDVSTCFKEELTAGYGRITPQFIYQRLAPMHKTGDTQLAIFDYSNYDLYIGFSRNTDKNREAYLNPPMVIQLGDFL